MTTDRPARLRPARTLRGRLVGALVALLSVGMLVYGVATYRVLATAERARLDQQITASASAIQRELAGGPGGLGGRGPGGRGDGPPVRLPPGTYAELRDRDGDVRGQVAFGEGAIVPDLSELGDLSQRDGGRAGDRFVTVTSPGQGTWRVLLRSGAAGTLVVAVPTASVDAALQALLRTEVVAGLLLVGALGLGAWGVLRRGLRPLEEMAVTARGITAGSLGRRVPVDGSSAELATLGRALNGMLDDLQSAFAERAATEARLRRFVADASHELRTPLTSIQGYAELFRLGRDAPPAMAVHVDADVIARRIEAESARMRRLVEDLLTLARLDDPGQPVRAPVDLAVLAADACADAVAMAPDRPVRLDAPQAVPLLADEAQLRQAIGNLIANAVRHTPGGTPIEVRAHREQGMAVLAVRDHGPGLDGPTAARAFDRFWQADAARSGAGAGLGLSIVKAIAEAHRGTVQLGTHPDGGAVATLALPAEPPDPPRGDHPLEHPGHAR